MKQSKGKTKNSKWLKKSKDLKELSDRSVCSLSAVFATLFALSTINVGIFKAKYSVSAESANSYKANS